MTMLRLTISIAVIALLALSLYPMISPTLSKEPGTATEQAPAARVTTSKPATVLANGLVEAAAPDETGTTPVDAAAHAGATRLIEIYGRVTDVRGEPIEDVLVTEERYFFAARSDADGRYRILVDLPRQRLPILDFLRAGYAAGRVKLTQSQLQDSPLFPLDMMLSDSSDTLRLSGWVANDLGIALEGVRIEISAIESDEEHNFFLTVFSDARGNFVLEGVRANTHYRLTAMLAPEYPVYSNPDFYVGGDSRQLDIELKSLKFINLSGMIRNPESAPVANFEFYIKNISTGLHSRKIVSDSSGYFTLDQFPLGEVSLSTRGTEFDRISGLTLTEDNYASLVLIVDRGDRFLSGWVTDNNGVALAKAMVTLDATLQDGAIEYFSYRSQTTDSSGHFSFDNLASGNHRITVYAGGYRKLETWHRLQNQSDQLQLQLTPQD